MKLESGSPSSPPWVIIKRPPRCFFSSETILLHSLSKVFKKYLTPEAYDDFSQYGYYTMLYKNTNLRLISLNCILCNSINFNLIGDSFQISKMFNWLEKVLNSAEKKGEKIYLLDHIPMYTSQQTYEFANSFINFIRTITAYN